MSRFIVLGIMFSFALATLSGPAIAYPSPNDGGSSTTPTAPSTAANTCDRRQEGLDWIGKDSRIQAVNDALDKLILEWANVDNSLFGSGASASIAKSVIKKQLVDRKIDFVDLAETAAVRLKDKCKKCAVVTDWSILKAFGTRTPGRVESSTDSSKFIDLAEVTETMISGGSNNFDNIIRYQKELKKFGGGNPELSTKINSEINGLVHHISLAIRAGSSGTKMTELEDQFVCPNFVNPYN